MGRRTIEKCYEKGYVTDDEMAIIVRLYRNGRVAMKDLVWAVWNSNLSVEAGDDLLDSLGIPEKIVG